MNKITILVVEDDLPISKFNNDYTQSARYKFLTAGSGNEAIMQASSYNPDIVFLDLGLPDIDGIDVIKKSVHGPICLSS